MIDTLILLLGRSGVGKTTLQKLLCDTCGFSRLVTTTTRAPREGEVPDVDYHFVSQDEFDKEDLVFRSKVYQAQYGITRQSLDLSSAACPTVVLAAAPEGLSKIAEMCRSCVLIHLRFEDGLFGREKRPDSIDRARARYDDDVRFVAEVDGRPDVETVWIDGKLPEEVLLDVVRVLRRKGVECIKSHQ